ncbi:MAG TPA: alpha/beta family hydrolase [Terriglobales bacterium]|nr:alpha/beta family hydrolase [Terriglobales bacterium]
MRITTGTFPGEAGKLEYILNEPDGFSAAPARAALVCHPHPLYGGTMHTRVVFQATRTFGQLGWPVLRFHFRGVGKSDGVYDRGRGERADLKAALAFLRQLTAAPVLLAGFSFGASMVTRLLAAEARSEVAQAVLMGLPVDRQERGDELPTRWAWQGPKLMISGDHDEFASVAALELFYAQLEEPKARQWIAGGDHFMAGRGAEFQAALRAHVQSQAGQNPA